MKTTKRTAAPERKIVSISLRSFHSFHSCPFYIPHPPHYLSNLHREPLRPIGNIVDRACFSINGIDIDLDELEAFESRLKQKRAEPSSEVNGLESRLGQLELRSDGDDADVVASQEVAPKDDLDLLYEEIQRRRKDEDEQRQQSGPVVSLGSLLLAFLSLLAFINQICYVQGNRQQLIER